MMPDGALAMPAAALAAVVLDRLLGEVRRFHPLVGFGNLAAAVEKRLNNRRLPSGLLGSLHFAPTFGRLLLPVPFLQRHVPFGND